MIKHRKKWVFAGVGGLILIVGFLLLRFLPLMGVEKHLNNLRAQGLPTSTRELDAWYKQVPAQENAALAVLRGLDLMVAAPPQGNPYAGKTKLPTPGEPLPPELREMIDRHLSNNAAAIAMFYEAVPLRATRYPINLNAGPNTLLPHLARVKASAQLLNIKTIGDAYANDVEGETRAVLAGLAVANSLHEEPLRISQLVRFACIAIAVGGLEIGTSVCAFSDDQLIRLGEALAETEDRGNRSLYKGMVGERALALATFDMTAAELRQFYGGTPGGSRVGFDNFLREIAFGAQHAAGLRLRDKSLFLEMHELFADAANDPFPERIALMERAALMIDDRFKSRWSRLLAPLTRMTFPTVLKTAEKEAINVGQVRCARTALAVERFRLKHNGELPQTLNDLVPEYLPSLLEDPFDGKALQIEKLGDVGYRIRALEGSKHIRNTPSKKNEGLVFVVKR